MKESEIDRTLQEIEPHAREFPVRFASAQQRSDMQDKLVRLLVFLDGVSRRIRTIPMHCFVMLSPTASGTTWAAGLR